MVLKGPAPSERATSRPSQVAAWTDVPNVPYSGARPRLPVGMCAEVRRWWQAVSRLPHAVLWDGGDWEFMLDLATLKQAFHSADSPSPALAAEVRRREYELGLTREARRKLRIRYVDPPAAEQAPAVDGAAVARLDDRRRRLAEGGGGPGAA